MENAIVPIERRAAAVVEFSPDQIDLIKRQICKGASDDELKLFLTICRKTGLDPFTRQIYALKRREYDKDSGQWVEKFSFQASIDGMRLVAERTGEYEGQTPPQWCGDDGKWVDVWLKPVAPSASRVGVYRRGFREPVWGVARWGAYAQTTKEGRPFPMWAKMGDTMLAKCAESLALRKGFPQELSSIYSEDEMAQANTITAEVAKLSPKSDPEPEKPKVVSGEGGKISQKQAARLFAIARESNWSDEQLRNYLSQKHGYDSTSQIPWTKYEGIVNYVMANRKGEEEISAAEVQAAEAVDAQMSKEPK